MNSLTHSLSKFTKLVIVAVLILAVFFTNTLPAQAATLDELTNTLKSLQQTLNQYFSGRVLGTTITTVSTAAELSAALTAATGGETILLNPGNYGVISIQKSPATKVTVSSRDANAPAVVTKITINGSNWHFNNLDMRPVYTGGSQILSNAVTITGSDVIFENSTVTYGNSSGWSAANWTSNAGSGIIASNGSNVLIKNNHLKTVYMGISIDHTMSNAKVINNTLDGVAGDALRGRGDYGLFENNLILNMKQIDGNHSDCFQSWSKLDGVIGKGEVVGVVIRGNQCLAALNTTDPIAADTQGYSIFDGVARNWIVENNISFSNTFHGSFLSGGNNSVIRNNTLVGGIGPLPGISGGNAAQARIDTTKTGIDPVNSKVQNNIVNRNLSVTDANVTYTNNVSVKYENYDTWFVDWRNGNFALKAGAQANGAGATPVASIGSSRTITNPTGGGIVTPTPTPVAPTLTLTSSVASVTAGDSATLTWSSTNATACTASGSWTGSKAVNGTQSTGVLSNVGTQTYTLSCTGTGGTVTKSVSVVVTSAPTPTTPTLTLTSSAASITTGSNATLTWNSTNATACTATGAWSGAKTVNGTQSTGVLSTVGTQTYTLTCTGTGGSVTNSVSVAVTAGTVITPVPTPIVTPFKINDRVSMTKNVNVRTSGLISATTLIGTNPLGSTGTLTAGPTQSADGIIWFNVNFDTGFDGWVGADNYLKVVTPTPVPTPTPNVTTTATLNVRSTAGGTLLGTQPSGATGITSPSTQVTLSGTTWIYVNFTTGLDGYVSATYLTGSGVSTTNQTLINSLIAQLAVLQAALAALLAQ